MNREEKAVAIAEIAEEIDRSEAIFALDYRGLTVAQAAELRAKLREADASFKVVKNSLTERAADQAGMPDLKEHLTGPTALTFVRGDIAQAAKAVSTYAKETELLPFKGGIMEGAPLDAEAVRALSRLPSREVLYGQLVGVVAAPIGGLVRSLGGLLGGLAVALGQVREKKESGEIPSGDAPAAPEGEAPASAPEAEAAEETTSEASGEPAADGQTDDAPAAEAEGAEDKAEADAAADKQPEDAAENPTKENE
jgi:large subunit ribosomal protein L10